MCGCGHPCAPTHTCVHVCACVRVHVCPLRQYKCVLYVLNTKEWLLLTSKCWSVLRLQNHCRKDKFKQGPWMNVISKEENLNGMIYLHVFTHLLWENIFNIQWEIKRGLDQIQKINIANPMHKDTMISWHSTFRKILPLKHYCDQEYRLDLFRLQHQINPNGDFLHKRSGELTLTEKLKHGNCEDKPRGSVYYSRLELMLYRTLWDQAGKIYHIYA